MSSCFYCKKEFGINASYYLMRTKDRRFRGRKRHQTVAYCCKDCEADGKKCSFTTEEWDVIRRNT